jgi:hypothetical protein
MWLAEPPTDTGALVADLSRNGLDPAARPAAVASLGGLLPDDLWRELSSGESLLIVPLGELWTLPWPAMALPDGRFVGEAMALSFAPSLSLAGRVDPERTLTTRPRTVGLWRSPEIRHHHLVAFDDDHRVEIHRLATAGLAHDALTRGGHGLVVVAGHGRPVPELGHYLELDDQTLLTPTDLLVADPPPEVALVSCWGAVAPTGTDGDPLTLATILMARGSRAVMASTSEVADDAVAARFVNSILYRLPDATMPEAVQDATARLLRQDAHRDGYLSRWAPIVTLAGPEGG